MNTPSELGGSTGRVEPYPGKDSRCCFQLEFNERAEGQLVNFYEPETANEQVFRWSEPVAMVRMNIPANEYEVAIDTAGLRGQNCPFRFKLFWNDQVIHRSQIRIHDGQIIFAIDRSMFIRNDEQRLTISCKPLKAENGRRRLGMPVKCIRLNQVGKPRCEFSNPTKSRSRLWQRDQTPRGLRRLVGMKSPSPNLPIWEVKLPEVASMLPIEPTMSESHSGDVDTVIVSSVEINSRHGTGLLIQYLFEDLGNVATVSSHRCYHGDRVRSAVHHEVPNEEMKRHELYQMVLGWFRESPPKQAYVVPYYRTELLVAIALADLFETKICLHVMDDQCLYENEISDALMREAIRKANLVLTISPEMKAAYEERFGGKVYILPPIVPDYMILDKDSLDLNAPSAANAIGRPTGWGSRVAQAVKSLGRQPIQKHNRQRGILIGNVWDPKWLELLRQTIGGSGYEVDWYSNNPDAMILNGKRDELAAAGILLQDPLWGDELVAELRQRPYAIMPSGTLDRDEPRESIARLSLPSRVPFVTAVAQIPIIVLGSRETAAARFVNRFDLGAVVDYEAGQFKSAVDYVLDRTMRAAIGERAAKISPTFSAGEMKSWLWESVRLRQPVDNRFENVFSAKLEIGARLQEPENELTSCWHRDDLQRVLRRLSLQGVAPERIIDVGAANGSWSRTACQVFPDAQFVMIEPLMSKFADLTSQHYRQLFRSLDTIDASASDSLDSLAEKHQWHGSTVLRIDVRSAEHLVLAGGANFINAHVDVAVLELTLDRKNSSAKSYREVLEAMDGMGFDIVDEFEARRCVRSGRLKQKNVIFVKRNFDRMLAAA